MKKSFLLHGVLVLSFAISISIALSSCAFPSGKQSSGEKLKEAETEVENTLTAYLSEMQSGKFTDINYESEFANASPFEDLNFPDEDTKAAMLAGLERITYEIQGFQVDLKGDSASCDLSVTALDIQQIQTDLEASEGGFFRASFMEAIAYKDAPMKTQDITLDLTYDSDEEVWRIEDSSALVEIVGDPFTSLVFDTDYAGAVDVLDAFMKALVQGDTGTIDELCTNLDSSDFFPQDEFQLLLAAAIYSATTYTVSGEPQGTENAADINVVLTMPNMDENYVEAYNDVDLVADSLKPAILNTLQEDDATDAAYIYRSAFYNELALRFGEAAAYTDTYDVQFSLTFDKETQKWSISSVPTELMLLDTVTGYDPLLDLTEQHLQIAIEQAADELYQAGSIDQQQQGDVDGYFLYALIPDTADPFANITTTGWKDPVTGEDVTSYDSGMDAQMMYVLILSSDWGDFDGHIAWYDQDASVILYEEDFSYNYMDGILAIYAVYPPEENPSLGWISADTYKVVISLSDGSVLAESTIEVT